MGGEDATLAEVLGLREAQQWVTRLKLNRVVIEMDARKAVDTIVKRSYPMVYWGRVAKNGLFKTKVALFDGLAEIQTKQHIRWHDGLGQL
jgi:hypothetical protein